MRLIKLIALNSHCGFSQNYQSAQKTFSPKDQNWQYNWQPATSFDAEPEF